MALQSSQPGKASCSKTTLVRLATLMGAFRLKNYPERLRNNDRCLSSLFSSPVGNDDFVSDNETSSAKQSQCCVPSLSLTSWDRCNHPHPEDKHQAEEHAASNLARTLSAFGTSVTTGEQSTKESHISNADKTITIQKLPRLMLDNLTASFLTLVDARLRAYITILARHGVSLSACPGLNADEQREGVLAVEQKLNTLVQVGTGVTVENAVSFFRIDDDEQPVETEDGIMMPLVMESTFDVTIPKFDDGHELVTVSVSTKGSIKASFACNGMLLSRVDVQVDTHELLSELIDRASLVMSTALDIVVSVSALPPQFPPAPLPKHDSTTADMPPPKPVADQVSGQFAVISPEIKSSPHDDGEISPLDLEETDLSPESCAHIIDFVIGEVDQILFPPIKRARTS